MSAQLQEMLTQLRGLSREDRTEIACFLLDSLSEDASASWESDWLDDVRRRERDADAGSSSYLSAEEVFAELSRDDS